MDKAKATVFANQIINWDIDQLNSALKIHGLAQLQADKLKNALEEEEVDITAVAKWIENETFIKKAREILNLKGGTIEKLWDAFSSLSEEINATALAPTLHTETHDVGEIHLSISELSRRADYGCERHLRRYYSDENPIRDMEEKLEITHLSEGLKKRGIEFETKVNEWLSKKERVISAEQKSLQEIAQEIEKMDEGKQFYTWQLCHKFSTAKASPELAKYTQLMTLKPDLVRFLKVNKTQVQVCVIDIKSSTASKPSHQMQIAFYSFALLTDLTEKFPKFQWDFTSGGVWLPTSPNNLSEIDATKGPRIESFSIDIPQSFVLRLLRDLPVIFQKDAPQNHFSAMRFYH